MTSLLEFDFCMFSLLSNNEKSEVEGPKSIETVLILFIYYILIKPRYFLLLISGFIVYISSFIASNLEENSLGYVYANMLTQYSRPESLLAERNPRLTRFVAEPKQCRACIWCATPGVQTSTRGFNTSFCVASLWH